jgi:hypothetical protein
MTEKEGFAGVFAICDGILALCCGFAIQPSQVVLPAILRILFYKEVNRKINFSKMAARPRREMSRSRIFSTRPLPLCLPIAQECLWGALPLEKGTPAGICGSSTEWAETLTILKKIMLLARIRADPMQPARVYHPSAAGFQ